MVKHSSKKRGGIRENLKKSSFRISRDTDDHSSTRLSVLLNKLLEQAVSVAKSQWTLLLRTCSILNVITIAIDLGTGKATLASLWKRCIHYVLVTLYIVIWIYRTYVTFERVAQGRLDILTYTSLAIVMIHVTAACSFLGCTWLSQRLCDILNNCKSLENILKMKMGQEKSVFDDKAVSIKVLLLIATVNVIGINATMISLMGIPASVVPILMRIGWLNLPDVIPRILWGVLFLPLEFLSVYPLCLYVGVCGTSIVLGLGNFKVFADQLRKKRVRCMEDWKLMYRLYRVMQVYNAILMAWFKNVASGILFSASCAIIILLYVTVRPSDLHFLIYIWFPIAAALLQVTMSWVVYDVVITKRAVTDVVGNLDGCRSRCSFMNMDGKSRAILTRRIKSLRPACITIGEFSDVSFDLAVNVWDEILNQLLFLLSL